MSASIDIIGSFTDDQLCARGIEELRAAQVKDFHVFSPIPSHHLAEASGKPKSIVRAWVLVGGISGVISGLLITIGTSWEWNLVVGGKPIVSWPPFIIICFELMILLGGVFAVLGFMFTARMPALDSAEHYHARYCEDRFGVVVRCNPDDQSGIEKVEAILKAAGAEEVLREAA